MTSDLYWQIRNAMKEAGIWSLMYNTKPYTVQELFDEIGEDKFPEELKTLLRLHVSRVQVYLDDRIIEPLDKL